MIENSNPHQKSRIPLNLLACLLLLAGFGLMAGGLMTLRKTQHEKLPQSVWLSVAPNSLQLNELQPRETRIVHFALKNQHPTQTVRILGASDYCGAMGCIVTQSLPLDVPPMATISLDLEFQSGRSHGRFTMPYSIFTDAPGQSEIILDLIGTVMAMPAEPGTGKNQPEE